MVVASVCSEVIKYCTQEGALMAITLCWLYSN